MAFLLGGATFFHSLSLRRTFFTQHFESIFQPVQSQYSVNQYIGREILRGGGWGAPEVNNLVYTKRQKHNNANSTHETTNHNGAGI